MNYCYECGCEHGYHLPRCSNRIDGPLEIKRCIPVSTMDFRKMVESAVDDTTNKEDILGASIGILLGFCNELADRVNELQAFVHTHKEEN